MLDKKVSIIVPVYKVEPWLRRCVDSILTQTYTNFELILVDDGSPDQCGEICDEYAKKDSRVIVIHQGNKGVSAARNAALDIATGEYIGFVDSDDYIDSVMYERLVEGIDAFHAEISFCGVHYITDQGEIEGDKQNLPDDSFRAIDQQSFVLGALAHEDWVTWNKLYKREKIGALRFDENARICEDALFLLEYSKSICTAAQTDWPYYYYYYYRQGSATRIDPYHSVTTALPVHERMITVGAGIGKAAFFMAQASYLDCCLQYIKYNEAHAALKRYVRKHLISVINNPYIFWKTRILYLVKAF